MRNALHPDFALRPAHLERPFVPIAGFSGAALAFQQRATGRARAAVRGWPEERRMRRAAFLIVEELKNLSAVNVREPSHLAPPFRATPIRFFSPGTAAITNLTYDDANSVVVTFGGGGGAQSAVPDAMRAEVIRATVFGVPAIGGSYVDPALRLRWQIQVRGQVAPGYEDEPGLAPPSTTTVVGLGSLGQLPPELVVPIHLVAGDAMRVRFRQTVAASNLIPTVAVQGWLYPVRAEELSIRGTLVD